MILPSLIPIAGVLIVGFALGAEALGGLLIGSIISKLFVAISMTSGGAHGIMPRNILNRVILAEKVPRPIKRRLPATRSETRTKTPPARRLIL